MRKLAFTLTLFLICGVQIVFAQKVVTGKVTDANDGTSLPGVNVSIKGTNLGTATGATGEYSLRLQANAKTLVFSFVGYDKQEVLVQSTSVINVQLKPSSQTLDEVVITAMGVKRQARSIGASSTNISSGDLIQAKPVNAVTGLTGKVSGLMINLSDNSVNPQVRIELRGNRHITGNNQALVVLDGVIVDPGVLVRLNPNDIESSNVLKGASAAAIYGSDASNGVLVITTKKGSSSRKSQITLSSTIQFESISLMPNLQNSFGSYGGESPDMLLGIQFPSDPTKYYFPYENQSYGPAYNGQMVPLGGPVRIYRPDGTYYDSTRMVKYSPVKNGKLDFFNTGITFQKDLSIASGGEGSETFFSYQNVTNSGVVPKDKYERNAFRFNTDKQINSYLKLSFSTSYTSRKYDQAAGAYFQDRPVYWTVVNAPQHVDLNALQNWRTDPFASPDGYYNAYYSNPYWQLDQSRNVDVRNDFVGNIKTSLDFTSWLNLTWSIGYVRGDEKFNNHKAGLTFAAWAIADPWEAGTIPYSQKLLLPSMNESVTQDAKLSSDLLLTFKKKINDFSTQLILGNSVWKRSINYENDYTSSLSIPDLYNIGYIQGNPSVGQSLQNYGLIGYFADVTFGYKNYIFVHGSGRYDESSLLAKGNRNFFYPGVDASFVFTDAFKGLSDLGWLSFGKIRAAITKVGSVSVSPYALNTNAGVYGGFPYGSTIAYGLSSTYGNSNLKPEFTTEKEAGFELGFFRNKISLTATYYNSLTINQTINASLSATSGYLATTANIGQMSNKGIELDLNLLNIFDRSEFKVNFGINYAYNKNEVLGLLSGDIALSSSSPGVYASNGNPYPYLKGSDFVRDPQGHIVVDANTGFPSLAGANTNFGTTNPPTKIGMNLQVTYRGFTLRAVADGRFGAVIYNNIGNSLDFTGISANSASRNRQPFVIPNTVIKQSDGTYKPNTDVVTKDANWVFWANTWNAPYSSYVNSADFWKIREISLTYNVPNKFIVKAFKNAIQSVSVVLSGRNLFTFRAKDNIWSDPEFSNSGSGNALGYTNVNQTPPTRIIGATLNVVF